MIVIDASAVVDILLDAPGAEALYARAVDETLVAPHLLDYEVVSTIRRMLLRGELRGRRADAALDDFDALRVRREGASAGLRRRMVRLRDAVSGYDAAYVALAEAWECPLVTRDGRLARSSGHGAVIELL